MGIVIFRMEILSHLIFVNLVLMDVKPVAQKNLMIAYLVEVDMYSMLKKKHAINAILIVLNVQELHKINVLNVKMDF